MKKILLIFLFVTSFTNAQYTIDGTLTETLKTDWIILYKINGGKQKFIANTTIKKETIIVEGKNTSIGTFRFTLPKDTETGSYRATYKQKGAGFVDFIFNKENIAFAFNPDYPEESILFSKSIENKIYQNYLDDISQKQQKLDAIQVAVLKDTSLNLSNEYKIALNELNTVQNQYLKMAKDMYVSPFIRATLRKNPSEIIKEPRAYMSHLKTTFFDNMDFSNPTLKNSSFLTNRITDYLFYINFSDDKTQQNKLFKNSVDVIASKIKNPTYKEEIVAFLIAQFEPSNNLELIDYLLDNYYKKLPKGVQNKTFVKEKETLFAAEIGRIAPNFSWKENGKKLELSTLNTAKNYLLVFWSTDCSHCLREIPQLHAFTKDKQEVKVLAFAMERNDFTWKNKQKNLPNWHHILGLNKWENKIARTYNINSTPSYFILNADKKIIAKPDELKDVKAFLDKL